MCFLKNTFHAAHLSAPCRARDPSRCCGGDSCSCLRTQSTRCAVPVIWSQVLGLKLPVITLRAVDKVLL